MVQAAVCDCLGFDVPPLGEDSFPSSEVNASQCHVADSLVVEMVVVVVDEVCDGRFRVTFEEVVAQHVAAFKGLMQSLDLALGW